MRWRRCRGAPHIYSSLVTVVKLQTPVADKLPVINLPTRKNDGRMSTRSPCDRELNPASVSDSVTQWVVTRPQPCFLNSLMQIIAYPIQWLCDRVMELTVRESTKGCFIQPRFASSYYGIQLPVTVLLFQRTVWMATIILLRYDCYSMSQASTIFDLKSIKTTPC